MNREIFSTADWEQSPLYADLKTREVIEAGFNSVEEGYVNLAEQVPDNLRRCTEAWTSERIDSQIELDNKFIVKVLEQIKDLAEASNRPITVLFDIDQTIAQLIMTSDGSKDNYTLVRPAASVLCKLIEELYGDRLDIGMLTSRSYPHLQEELRQPTYTEALGDRFNPDHVYSCRPDDNSNIGQDIDDDLVHYTLFNPQHAKGSPELTRAMLGNVVDDLTLYVLDEDPENLDIADMLMPKIVAYNWAVGQHPDRSFVFADDDPSLEYIEGSHSDRARAVCVQSMGFYLNQFA